MALVDAYGDGGTEGPWVGGVRWGEGQSGSVHVDPDLARRASARCRWAHSPWLPRVSGCLDSDSFVGRDRQHQADGPPRGSRMEAATHLTTTVAGDVDLEVIGASIHLGSVSPTGALDQGLAGRIKVTTDPEGPPTSPREPFGSGSRATRPVVMSIGMLHWRLSGTTGWRSFAAG